MSKKHSSALIEYQLDDQVDQPLYQQVQTTIRNHIDEGRLQAGDRLPSLQCLSREMGIAYATVVRGVRELVQEGVLEARPGSGTVVSAHRPAKTSHVGVFAYFPFSDLLQGTRYYRALLFLIQETLVTRGQTVVYNRWDKETTVHHLVRSARPVDGAVLFHVSPQQLPQVRKLQAQGMALICVGDSFSDARIPAVHTTSEQDTRHAVQLLRERGHSCIAALHPTEEPPNFTVMQRLDGFRAAMRDLPENAQPLVVGEPDSQAEQLLALKKKPTALVILHGAGDYRRLHQRLRGTSCELGKHTALAIWDENLWQGIAPLGIPFIGVEQPLKQIAEIAVNELLRMQSEPDYKSRPVYVSSQIVETDGDGQRRVL